MKRLLVLLLVFPASASAGEQTFSATGAEQTFSVPAGVTVVHVVAVGAPGGKPTGNNGSPGPGATATADLAVHPGEVLYVEVGGPGVAGSGPGGFNGGGSGGTAPDGAPAGGGGASDVRTTPRAGETTLESRVVVAGGGGGGGSTPAAIGGAGGGPAGGDGLRNTNGLSPCAITSQGLGGTQTMGGAAGVGSGNPTAGTFGTGGSANKGDAGGGGGWWGGGASALCGGGGGGSGHFGPGTFNAAFGVAGASEAPRVGLSWADPVVPEATPAPTVSAAPTPAPAPVPDATITKHPRSTVKTKAKRVKVRFFWTATDERATFRCTLDGGNDAACDSGFGYRVKAGKHTFAVVATLNSVRDPTPATYAFTVKKSKNKHSRSQH